MKKEDFKAIMAEQTDAELLRILAAPEDNYQPEALAAARAEFSNRNLSESAYMALKEANDADQQAAQVRAAIPLNFGWKFLAFIFPGIIPLLFAGVFKADGYHRKAGELTRWTFYGIGFYILAIILIKTTG
ncbi:hypothetical protein [Niabella sp.]|uniref:hypothetical protein n=1 Tax=Niabella sp. TaxID=1962976 RepID=UPI0026157CF0|nr:hypothetical protein [Niabella sp.]